MLEAQYAAFSTRPDYGTAHESVQLFDMDADELITPDDVGLSVNLDHINDFMVSNGANPYTTIGLYSPA